MASAADFLTKLPSFVGVEVAVIQAYLDEAGCWVLEGDYGTDYDRAHIYLAAHMMTVLGLGPSMGGVADIQLAGVTSIQSASLSFDFGGKDHSMDDAGGDYASTPYGRLFYHLLVANRRGPRVTGSGTLNTDLAVSGPMPYGGNDGANG